MAVPMMSMVGFKDVIVFVRGFTGNAVVIGALKAVRSYLRRSWRMSLPPMASMASGNSSTCSKRQTR